MSTLNLGTIKSLTADTPTVFKDSSDTEIGQLCRAWVTLNGQGVIAILDSFNVSSITDINAGQYTITWDTDFDNAYYCVSGFAGVLSGPTTNKQDPQVSLIAVGSMKVVYCNVSGTNVDPTYACVAAFAN